jgi:gamma-glutamylcyclotransferase (GGCT)/AIG2-like uncharacterized protein YtfP
VEKVMPLLFSYGTLQKEDVQRSTFGRRLEGRPDSLPGFQRDAVKIEDAAIIRALGRTHHANVIPANRTNSGLEGTVFEITDAELAQADEFEAQFSYRRVAVTLASGNRAWVYVHQPLPGE